MGESLAAGAVASAVALRHGLHRNQLYGWRRALRAAGCAAAGVEFAPVVVTDASAPARPAALEIALGGAVVRVGPGVDVGLLGATLGLLKRLA